MKGHTTVYLATVVIKIYAVYTVRKKGSHFKRINKYNVLTLC